MARLTRRDVLKLGSAAALCGAIPNLSMSQSKIILGQGEFQYEWVPNFLKPPQGLSFGDTHGLAQDSAGRFYLAHTVGAGSTSSDAVLVYNEDGSFKTSWGASFKGGAHGLDIRKEGNEEFLYHCDTARCLVVKTTLEGEIVWQRGVPEEAGVYKDGKRYVPTNVAFGPEGRLFVGDGYGSSYIHIYDAAGNYIKTFAGAGKDPGLTSSPHGLTVDVRGPNPLLYVADRSNRRIQVFDMDGKHVRFHTDGMRLPCHFDFQGDLVLVPDLQSVVTLLDEKSQPIVHLGDGDPTNLRGKPTSDFIPGKFIHPHDAIFTRLGDILVAEWVPQGRVTLLRRVRS
ncbi:hypothetical protein QPK87_05590 [Kamptonema cortianum]|nr:hypothetical protein [Geitlerinema splendidum]MDK3156050.1 hypothetical protein [Kamptonema cortianum]